MSSSNSLPKLSQHFNFLEFGESVDDPMMEFPEEDGIWDRTGDITVYSTLPGDAESASSLSLEAPMYAADPNAMSEFGPPPNEFSSSASLGPFWDIPYGFEAEDVSTLMGNRPVAAIDPANGDVPLRPPSAFLLFNQEIRSQMIEANPNASSAEISRLIAFHWKTLDVVSKNAFKNRALSLRRQSISLSRRSSETGNPYSVMGAYREKDPRGRKKKTDVNAPKHPRSAFLFFLSEVRPSVAQSCPKGTGVAPISKLLSAKWKELDVAERMRFDQMALADKERYRVEVADWKLKQGNPDIGK